MWIVLTQNFWVKIFDECVLPGSLGEWMEVIMDQQFNHCFSIVEPVWWLNVEFHCLTCNLRSRSHMCANRERPFVKAPCKLCKHKVHSNAKTCIMHRGLSAFTWTMCYLLETREDWNCLFCRPHCGRSSRCCLHCFLQRNSFSLFAKSSMLLILFVASCNTRCIMCRALCPSISGPDLVDRWKLTPATSQMLVTTARWPSTQWIRI